MANKKVSQLTSKPSVLTTDLFPIADPSTGQLYKTTISDLGTAIGSGVSSVNSLVGAVVLDTDDIQELVSPTNKWFTDTRARAAISAGTGISYNSGTGVITNAVTSGQIATALGYTPANGANYLPLAGGTMGGAIFGTIATFESSSSVTALGITLSGSSGDGIKITHSAGRAFNIQSSGSGYGLIINNETASTSIPFVIQKAGANKITFTDAGGATYSDRINTPTLYATGSSSEAAVTIYQNSGYHALSITQAGVGAAIYADGKIFANQFIRIGGASTSFLKADGSVDTNTYLTTSSASSTYLPLAGGTLTGALSGTSSEFSGLNNFRQTDAGVFVKLGGNLTKANIYQFTSGGLAGAVFNIGHNFYYNGTSYGQDNTAKSGWVISSNLNADTFAIARAAAGSTSAPTNVLSFASTGAATFTFDNNSSGVVYSRNVSGTTYELGSVKNSGSDILYQGTGNVFINADSNSDSTAADRNILFGNRGVEYARITSSGNVGIGTTSPSGELHVKAASGFAELYVQGGSSTSGMYLFDQNTESGLWKVDSGYMAFGTSNTERMRITSSGGVGINTTPDSGFKLHVNGYVKFNDASGVQLSSGSQYRQIYFDGFSTLYFWNGSNQSNLSSAGAWVNASDASIKKDVTPIKYGLSDLMLLNPRSYKMKTDDLEQIGFIAQEVEQVIPEVVNSDNKGMKGLSYGNMVALLTKSIQELKAELDTLKNK